MTDLPWLLAGMPPELLALRMGLVALFVVAIALVAERLGPFLGAMLASLPIYTGPVYLLLALEHGPAYITAATITSVAICGANPVLVLIYAILARRHGVALSVAGGLAAWLSCAAIVQMREWSLPEALLFVAPIYLVSLWLARDFTRGVTPQIAPRRWSDLMLRAALVAILTAVVIVTSRHVPPRVTGILSVVPILMTSIILVMHPRVGGRATAALLAHTLGGLVGMVIAFACVHLTIPLVGVWPALGIGLGITVAWNIAIIGFRALLRATCAPAAPRAQRASSAPTRSSM